MSTGKPATAKETARATRELLNMLEGWDLPVSGSITVYPAFSSGPYISVSVESHADVRRWAAVYGAEVEVSRYDDGDGDTEIHDFVSRTAIEGWCLRVSGPEAAPDGGES